MAVASVLLAALSWIACSRQDLEPGHLSLTAGAEARAPATEADTKACQFAAEQVLGIHAQLVRCGHLSGRNLEAVAVIRPPKLLDDRDGIPLTNLIIIQQEGSRWSTELIVENEIKNSFGYLAADYIDDSEPVNWFRVSFFNEGSSNFAISLKYVTTAGVPDKEGLANDIGWNPLVGRSQEILPNGEGFAAEKKTLPHIHTRKNCDSGPCS